MNKKILAILLALCLALASMPLAYANEPITITDEAGLMEAAAAGGEYTVDSFIYIENGITVTKDMILNLSETLQLMSGQDAFFTVKGATLTIRCANSAEVSYYGSGSAFALQDGASLELNGGNYYSYASLWGESSYPTSLIHGESGTTAVLNGGSFSTVTETGSHYFGGPLLTGDGALTVKAGVFHVDPSAYLAAGVIAIGEMDQWTVLEVAKEYGAEFTAILNEEKELVINRYEPTREEGTDMLVDALSTAYTYEMDGMEFSRFAFHGSTYDFDNKTIYVSLLDENWNYGETHRIPLVFEYDAAIKEQVDALVATLPEDVYNEEAEEYFPYTYGVSDLELFNYWMTCTEENQYDNICGLINYSNEFKEKIGYKNFRLDARMGDGGEFFSEAFGIANFSYNGTVYAAREMGVRADHVVYVPSDTEDVLGAIQARIDGYLGAGKVTVESLGPVLDVILLDHYNGTAGEWGQTDPDMTFEEWKASEYCPDYTAEDATGIIGLADDAECFETVINGIPYRFVAEKNDEKIAAAPIYKNVDFSTEVAVLTEDSSVPLDTMVQVDKLTEGAEYEEIMSVLDVAEHETYDIQLHSGSKGGYVTSLENGEFEVQIPISETLQDKDLIVYYVNENGIAEPHTVTPKNGNATFTTDHFSIYTLAAANEGSHTHDYTWDGESEQYVCDCGTPYLRNLDLNDDGEANTQDAILLLRTIDGAKLGIDDPAADISNDGKINVFDAVRYLQLLRDGIET